MRFLVTPLKTFLGKATVGKLADMHLCLFPYIKGNGQGLFQDVLTNHLAFPFVGHDLFTDLGQIFFALLIADPCRVRPAANCEIS